MHLQEILNKYSVNDIEKALILNYLNRNAIDALCHSYIKKYLEGFIPSTALMEDVASMSHKSLPELAVDMELLIPTEDRQTNGAFFTPQNIVDFIIQSIAPNKDSRVIDISCGCGAFVLGAIRYFKKAYNKKVSDIVRENVYGVDLLSYNVRRCKLLIILYGLSTGENIDESSINVEVGNSLIKEWERKYDVVVGNPPYVKFQDMEDETRDILEKNYRTTGFGTYNLYFAFFEIGKRLLTNGGVLGYITPNNYFTSLSGESLRSYFQSNKCISRIVDFNATKVFEVQTYTAITFLTDTENDAIGYARIGSNEEVDEFLANTKFTYNRYEDLNVKKWRLLCDNERDIITRIETCGEKIGNLFNIAVGIATLKDEAYFIAPYREDDKYYYCSNKYVSDFKIEKGVTRPHVKISKIKSADELSKNTRRIIFPYIVTNDVANIIGEDMMKSHFPECFRYLESIKEVLAGRGKGKHIYSPFYAYGRTQGLNKHGVKIYTPTFSQYPRYIYDDNKESLFTNGYGIFYKEEVEHSMDLFSEVEINPILNPDNVDVLLKVLNSGIMHFYVSKTSVSIDGGYPCYQKNFIERFSIPNMNEKNISAIRKLNNRDEIDKYLIKLYQIKAPSPNLWE